MGDTILVVPEYESAAYMYLVAGLPCSDRSVLGYLCRVAETRYPSASQRRPVAIVSIQLTLYDPDISPSYIHTVSSVPQGHRHLLPGLPYSALSITYTTPPIDYILHTLFYSVSFHQACILFILHFNKDTEDT